jgi:hypothetical protein
VHRRYPALRVNWEIRYCGEGSELPR